MTHPLSCEGQPSAHPITIPQPDRVLIRAFVAEYASGCTGDVLDVGGGNRRYAGLFPHARYRTLDVAARLAPDIVGSIEEMPVADCSIDTVLCTQVLADVRHLETAVAELARVLKPGGRLILTESLFDSIGEPPDLWRFTPLGLRTLLAPHFDVLVMEPRGGYHCMALQQRIRYYIDRYELSEKQVRGRLFAALSSWLTRRAIRKDAREPFSRFPLGYNVFAVKRSPTTHDA